jgi:hypothetical protein
MHKVVFSLVFFLCLFTPLGANSLNFENIKELPNGDIRISFKLQKVAQQRTTFISEHVL